MGVRGAHDGRRRTVITIARYENFVLRGAKKWGMIKENVVACYKIERKKCIPKNIINNWSF